MSLKEKIRSSIQELLYQRSVRQHNNLKVDGFIDIELVNNRGNVKYKRRIKQPNAITPAGKQMLLAQSAQSLLNMGSDYYGRLATISALYTRKDGSYGRSVRSSNNNRDITNLLLNLDNPEALTDADNYIPVLSEAGETENASKVIGYASSDTNPTADGKAGEADYTLPEYVVDGKIVAKRWKYKELVATGTINAVAMAPFSVYGHGSRGSGFRSAKCLDKVNYTYLNFVSFSTGFCPPGIPGITGATEVLLNYSQDGITQHKHDLATGETIDITSGWAGIPFPQNSAGYRITDYWYDGSRYLYLLNMDYSGSSSAYITVYDTQGGVLTYINYFTIYSPAGSSSSYRGMYACFLPHNGELYVSWLGRPENTSGGLTKLTKSGNYYNSYTSAGTDYSIVGLTVPSGLVYKDFALKPLANGRYALVMEAYPQKTTTIDTDRISGDYAKHAYVFTDLNDVFGSVVGVIEWMTNNGTIVSTPAVTGFLSVDFYNSKANQSLSYDVDGANQEVRNNSFPSGKLSGNPNGVWWSDLSWSSNVVSHVELTTPVEKAEDDILYVTYGYKIT